MTAETQAEWLEQLHGLLSQELIDNHGAVENTRGYLEFSCPTPQHNDSSPSAVLREYGWKCMGCNEKGGLKSLAQLLKVPVPKGRSGYTLEDYASEKDLDPKKLSSFGVHTYEYTSQRTGNTLDVVAIPYYDEDGELIRHRFRGSTQKWWEGSGNRQPLYGLWWLEKAPLDTPVLLVEGESDCHAAWHHKFGALAIGVPGSSAWQEEWAELFQGRKMYLWQEPGQGGKAFRQAIAKSFPKAGVLKAPDTVKDLSVMHMLHGDDTAGEIKKLMEVADPADAPEPPVKIHVVGEALLDAFIANQEQPIDAIPTFIPQLNDVCMDDGGGVGFAKGWNIIIGAATGGYKSTWVGNLAAHGVRIGKRVGWLGLEEAKFENLLRFIPPLTGVEAKKLYKGKWFDREAAEKAKAIQMEHFYRTGGTLLLPDKQIVGLDNVMDAYYYMVEVQGAEMVLVDYLQLAGDVAASESTLRKVAEISDRIRRAAEDLNVVNVSASQFKREGQQDRPHRGMLMGGSPLENDSDQVLLMDHTSVKHHNITDDRGTRRVTDINMIVDKNRHGPQGYDQDIALRFDPYNRRLMELAPEEPQQEVPE